MIAIAAAAAGMERSEILSNPSPRPVVRSAHSLSKALSDQSFCSFLTVVIKHTPSMDTAYVLANYDLTDFRCQVKNSGNVKVACLCDHTERPHSLRSLISAHCAQCFHVPVCVRGSVFT